VGAAGALRFLGTPVSADALLGAVRDVLAECDR
jgi:hypothetical protein